MSMLSFVSICCCVVLSLLLLLLLSGSSPVRIGFEFGPDQSFGEVQIGPVCHSGGAPEEPSEQRYVGAVVGTAGPVFQYYFECLLGVGGVSDDECGLLGFQWCFIIAFAVVLMPCWFLWRI